MNFNSKEKQIERTKGTSLKNGSISLLIHISMRRKAKQIKNGKKGRNNLKHGNVIVLIIMSRAGNFKK